MPNCKAWFGNNPYTEIQQECFVTDNAKIVGKTLNFFYNSPISFRPERMPWGEE
jgi:hypothetical protein